MKDLLRQADTVFRAEVTVLWRTTHQCEQKGFLGLADKFEYALTAKYAARPRRPFIAISIRTGK